MVEFANAAAMSPGDREQAANWASLRTDLLESMLPEWLTGAGTEERANRSRVSAELALELAKTFLMALMDEDAALKKLFAFVLEAERFPYHAEARALEACATRPYIEILVENFGLVCGADVLGSLAWYDMTATCRPLLEAAANEATAQEILAHLFELWRADPAIFALPKQVDVTSTVELLTGALDVTEDGDDARRRLQSGSYDEMSAAIARHLGVLPLYEALVGRP